MNSKNIIDYSQIKLILADINQLPTIQNIGRFYVYDMSAYMGNEEGWEIPENGLYECIDFQKYWKDNESYPFLLRYNNEIMGFAIVDTKGSCPDVNFNMAQFFILRKFQNKGIGKYVAQECFKKFPGIWEIMVMPENEGAYHFWLTTIKSFTNNSFTEYTRNIPHFNNSIKNIIKFNSEILST